MGNASLENKRVRQSITSALFTLMEKKSFSEITVSEIVATANVARASFYRNFDSKEAIIDQLIAQIHRQIFGGSSRSALTKAVSKEELAQRIEYALNCVLAEKYHLLALYRNGFGGHLQNIADIYIEELAGDMLYNSANRYLLYCFSGAAMNMLIHWLQDGAKESVHELALLCADYFTQMIPPTLK